MGQPEAPSSGLFSESSAPPPPDNGPETVLAFINETTGLPQRAGATHPVPVDVGVASITITAGQVDSSTFTAATTPFAPVGGVFDDDIADVPDGDAGSARITAKRALHTNLRDSSGRELGIIAQSTPLVLAAGGFVTRTSADIPVTGKGGFLLTVTLANKAGAATFTPKIQGKTKSGVYYDLWTAAAALNANGTAVYQIAPSAIATAGGITESKVALSPGVIRIVLTYTGNGSDAYDSTVDLDIEP